MRRGFVLFLAKIWNLGSSWYLCQANRQTVVSARLQEIDPCFNERLIRACSEHGSLLFYDHDLLNILRGFGCFYRSLYDSRQTGKNH